MAFQPNEREDWNFSEFARHVTDALARLEVHNIQQAADIKELKGDMKTALVPIQLLKWSVASAIGLSAFVGLIYGILQLAEKLKSI